MPAHCEAIAEVIAWLEEVSEREKWPLKTVFALTLCADEALTNIVTHANPAGDQPLSIQLQLGTLNDGVGLCIADNGAEFDPTLREAAPLAKKLDDAEMGGHGLRLMRHYLQRFEYRRSDGWNWLLLVVASDL
ncbi:ATP-binding protein [Comamonas sp. Y33R10-2]|nr:ATP-binding protein [Comamonas sp. Y33R10-2]